MACRLLLFRGVWLESKNLFLAKKEHQAGGDEADDAAHADIAQEVLRQVDARVGTQGGKYQQQQQRGVEQQACACLAVLADTLLIAVGQIERGTGEEDEEGRGVARGERIAAVQVDALYQGAISGRGGLQRRWPGAAC